MASKPKGHAPRQLDISLLGCGSHAANAVTKLVPESPESVAFHFRKDEALAMNTNHT